MRRRTAYNGAGHKKFVSWLRVQRDGRPDRRPLSDDILRGEANDAAHARGLEEQFCPAIRRIAEASCHHGFTETAAFGFADRRPPAFSPFDGRRFAWDEGLDAESDLAAVR